MNDVERRLLIDSLIDGEISEADFLRIEAELSVDPAARREYYDRLALSVLLEAEAADGSSLTAERAATATPFSQRNWWGAFLALTAAAVVLLAVNVWLWNSADNNQHNASPRRMADGSAEEQASGFAVVVGQADAVWNDGSSLANGSLLPPRPLRLNSGIVQLELFSGVTVVVEGDARFAILSPMEMTVAGGRVRAHVPEPAHGFKVRTAEGEVIDLGTEFAVSVSDGQSEVYVLDGEVEWHPREDTVRRMNQGDAVRLSADGASSLIDANSAAFVAPDELRERLATARSARRDDWRRFSETLRGDPRLVAYYQMASGESWSRRLPNRAADSGTVAGEGAIVAAVRSADRWGRPDGALDFSPTGSRVRLSVPGEYRSLTVLCWVKINSLDRWYNSLFLTDGHDLHEPHWQIMDDGRLFFSVKKRDTWDSGKGEKDKHIFYSPPFWSSSLSGQWLMIATVYDPESRRVTHYLNGEPLSQEEIPEEYLVEQISIGNASLGNWGLPERDEPQFAVRNLNGSMDEFLLFSAALDEEEIRGFYDQGRP